jgi:hypothetical protein
VLIIRRILVVPFGRSLGTSRIALKMPFLHGRHRLEVLRQSQRIINRRMNIARGNSIVNPVQHESRLTIALNRLRSVGD